jgi:hypothetical protein
MQELPKNLSAPEPSHVVTVFASGDPAAVIMAKLILEGEGIRFVTEGEGVQDFFGFGRALGGFNPITGPVQLRVASENAELALEALRELREGDGAQG